MNKDNIGRPYHPIGTELSKVFILDQGRQLLTGKITGYDTSYDPPLYVVTYEDGEWEHMKQSDL